MSRLTTHWRATRTRRCGTSTVSSISHPSDLPRPADNADTHLFETAQWVPYHGLLTPADSTETQPRRRKTCIDAINTFRCIGRSFRVVSRSQLRFPQVTRLYASVSIPGSSTIEGPGLGMVLSLGFSVSTPTMSTNRATILGHRLAAHALPQGRHHLPRGPVPARRTADVDVVRGPDDRHDVQGSGGCRRPGQGPGFRRCRSTPRPGQRQPATTHDSRAQNRG